MLSSLYLFFFLCRMKTHQLFFISSLVVVIGLAVFVGTATAQTPPDPPPDACNVYGGNNSTCKCTSGKTKGWITLGYTLGMTPLFYYLIMRYWVFTDIQMPGHGIGLFKGIGPYNKKVVEEFDFHSVIATICLTAVSAVVITARWALSLSLDETLICIAVHRFIWHVWIFWLFPLGVGVLLVIANRYSH